MPTPNRLHLDPFLSSHPLKSSPYLISSSPNCRHSLIVASDVLWCSAHELPACHWLPIVVKSSSSSRSVVIIVVDFVIISALPIIYAMLSASLAVMKGLVPQSEIDKQVHITNRDYSTDEYKRLTPAEKAMLWQLLNPNRTPGTGPTRRDRDSSVASTSTTATSASGKCQAEDAADKDEKPTDDSSWGRNRSNPVLGRQVRSRNEDDN
jgi:hypothetical protein